MINVGIIGYGYWGPNLVRNFAELGRCNVVAIADLDAEKLALAKRRFPAVHMTTDVDEVINDPKIDAIVIATPVRTHFKLGMAALKADKHVWLEKPMTETTEQARLLVDEAERRGKVLHVDHTFVYTGAVRKMGEIIARGDLGKILYYDSVRVNLGLFQHDVNVISDLAVHDFSILEYLLKEHPVAVSAAGINHFPGTPENLAYVTLFYDSSIIAHVSVNWRLVQCTGSRNSSVAPSIAATDSGTEACRPRANADSPCPAIANRPGATHSRTVTPNAIRTLRSPRLSGPSRFSSAATAALRNVAMMAVRFMVISCGGEPRGARSLKS